MSEDRVVRLVLDGEGPGPDAVVDALGLGAAEAEAVEPDRVGRGDVHLGGADAVGVGGVGDERQGEEGGEAEAGHRGLRGGRRRVWRVRPAEASCR